MVEPNPLGPFVMTSCREIIALSAGAVHIEQQVRAIESAVLPTPNLAFDLARTLVESVCKTILYDRGEQDCERLGFKDLLNRTYAVVQTVPDTHLPSQSTINSLQKILSAFDEAISGISDLRQAEGIASHGKDGYHEPLETLQAELVARAADLIVGFMYKAHRQYGHMVRQKRLEYADNPQLNDYIDELILPVQIFGLDYKPSEILFNVDIQAYQDMLANLVIEPEYTEGAETCYHE